MVLLIWFSNFDETFSKFENQINKAITSCFYAVKPRVVYNTRVMLSSAKKDSAPTTQKSCVVRPVGTKLILEGGAVNKANCTGLRENFC